MNFTQHYKQVLVLAIGLLFFSCAKDQASTEVENEIQISMLTGTAATGYPIAFAEWKLLDSKGTVFASGITDSLGKYQILFTQKQQLGKYYLVQIVSSDTLYSYAIIDSTALFGDSILAHVNPITDVVVRKLKNSNNPLTVDSIKQVGAIVVQSLFGPQIEWNAFAHDSHYQPALESRPTGYTPSVSDMMLHSMSNTATRLGYNSRSYIDSAINNEIRITEDFNYQMDFASNLALFGIPPEKADPYLMDFNDDIKMHYDRIRDLNGQQPNNDMFFMAMDLSNQSLLRSTSRYQDSLATLAQAHFSLATKLMADQLVIVLKQDQGKSPREYWMIAANTLGQSLTLLNPQSWYSDSLSTQEMLGWVLTKKIIPTLKSTSTIITEEQIEQWTTMAIDSLNTPFKNNPLVPSEY